MNSRLPRFLADHGRHLLLAMCSGALYFLGFCGFDQAYLAWICLVPILSVLDSDSLSPRAAIGMAMLFGFVTHLGAYTWITGMLVDFGRLPWPLALLGYALLCLSQGSLLGAWGYGCYWLKRRFGVPMVAAAPVTMVVAEWLYPALFPSYLANSQYRFTLFIQTLDLWGPLGLTLLLTLSSAVIYETIARLAGRRSGRPWLISWTALVVLMAADLLYGLGAVANIEDTVAHAERRLRVGIVQINMGIYEKHENPRAGLLRHQEQSLELQRRGADLIVWPESGYNYAIATGTKNVKQRVMNDDLHTPLLFGGLRLEQPASPAHETPERARVYNTAFLTDARGDLQATYDKIYLLAFGEYLPFGDWFPVLYDWSPQTGRFERGRHTRALELDGIRYGALICYEDILPQFVRQVMRDEPHVLVNITNDAWFGRTHEPLIHLALASFRAVEHRRFLVRATNTGISAVVDPAGRIVAQTPIFARANLLEEITPLSQQTLYAVMGDWIGWVCAACLLWWVRHPALAWLIRKPRRKPPPGGATSQTPHAANAARRKRG